MDLIEVLEDIVYPATQGFILFSFHLSFYVSLDLTTIIIIFEQGNSDSGSFVTL